MVQSNKFYCLENVSNCIPHALGIQCFSDFVQSTSKTLFLCEIAWNKSCNYTMFP